MTVCYDDLETVTGVQLLINLFHEPPALESGVFYMVPMKTLTLDLPATLQLLT